MKNDYDAFDSDDLRLMADTVQNEALFGLVMDASRSFDLRMLKTLRDVGRFRVTLEDLENPRQPRSPLVSVGAMGIVDALGGSLFNVRLSTSVMGAPSADRGLKGADPRLVSMEFTLVKGERQFLHDLCENIANDVAPLISTCSESGRDVALASLGVLAAIACAMDDAPLLSRLAAVEHGMVLGQTLQGRGFLQQKLDAAVLTPSAYAFLFGSLDCIHALGLLDRHSLQNVGSGPQIGHDNVIDLWTPFNLLARAEHGVGWSPALFDAFVSALRDSEGELPNTASYWLTKGALNAVQAGSTWLIQPIQEHDLLKLDVKAAESAAFDTAIPEFVQHVLEGGDFPFEPLDRTDRTNPMVWFKPGHPVRRLMDVPVKEVWDRDACMALVIHAMAEQDQVQDVFDVRLGGSQSFAEALLPLHMTRSVLALLEHGLDPMQPCCGEAPTLLALAESMGNDRLVTVMRATLARRAAQSALGDTDHTLARSRDHQHDAMSFDERLSRSKHTKTSSDSTHPDDAQTVPVVYWRGSAQTTDPMPPRP